jgi:hypothetical protein
MEEEVIELSAQEKQELEKLEKEVAGLENPKSMYQLAKQVNPGYSDPNVENKIKAAKDRIAVLKDPLAKLTRPEQEYLGSLRGQIGALEKGISTAEQAGRLAKESARVGAAQSLLGAERRGGVAAARQAGLAGSREAALQRLAAEQRATGLGKELAGAKTEFVGEKEKLRKKGIQTGLQLQTDITNLRNDMAQYIDNVFYTSASDVANAKQLVRTLLAKYADNPEAQAQIKQAAQKLLEANTSGAFDTKASTTV